MKNENITTTTILLAFNILLVLLGLLMINKRIINSDEKSDSLKVKISEVKNPTYLISMLNEYLFDEIGFCGAVVQGLMDG